MKQAAKTKRHNSYFRTAPDGRLLIDIDDEENQQKQKQESDDDDDDDINREDIKDLMETLSLSQRAKNKRKRTFENDDEDEDDYQFNDKQSQSVHSKYRGDYNQNKIIFFLFFFLLYHQAGGSGIHRPLNQPSKQQKRPGNVYKAKV
jgi:hypothetical protein